MSASLVGSEMCIRDSIRPAKISSSMRALGARRPRRRGHHVVPARRRGQGPVSYTHLTLPTICSV
eukprot:3787651-Alexandrium_andersonii.AAC.1